ncbi:MAG: adenosylcobinamide-phosphate synthase CbiB [SAR324 cluster bacterium]|nr:adenosylcobinamide-phosphate synthase CbiB [SAR324 cluster bacterium]
MNVDLVELLTHPAVILASIIGLDLLFGDPIYCWHPIRLIGNLLSWFETKLWTIGLNGKFGGIILVLLLLFIAFVVSTSILHLFSALHWSLSWLWSVYLGWSFLALQDLLVHAKHVAEAMEKENLSEAKRQVGMLVGRDTKLMDLPACGRATVESISENLNDGVIAPLFFFCFFGIHGMLFFKVVSTLDSMVGYKNKRYQEFGRCSAKLDDLLSWIPARISWLLLSGTAALFQELSCRNAFKVGWKDHAKLASSNAGWCEATAAGALKIRLCGPIWRDGKLAYNYWLGRQTDREGATAWDIQLVSRLALATSLIVSVILGYLLWLSEFKPFFSV